MRSDSNDDDDDDSSKRDTADDAAADSNPFLRPHHSSGPSMTMTSFALLSPKQPPQTPPTANTSTTTMTTTTQQRQQQQQHNRNVTPHTASLMSLFARPPISSTTPLTPPLTPPESGNNNGGAVESSTTTTTTSYDYDYCYYGSVVKSDAPSLPEEDDDDEQSSSEQQHSVVSNDDEYNEGGGYYYSSGEGNNNHNESITPKNSNSYYNNSSNYSIAAATTATPTAIQDAIARGGGGEKTPLLPASTLSFRRQRTTEEWNNKTTSSPPPAAAAGTTTTTTTSCHNRDDTRVIDNLSKQKQQPQQQPQQQQSWPWGNEHVGQPQQHHHHHRWGEQQQTLTNISSENEEHDDDQDESTITTQQQQQQQQYRPSCSLIIHSTLSKAGLDTPHEIKSTLIGAFLFSLYQLVFIFAEASAISRPSHPSSASNVLLSPMANMACFGSLIVIPILTGVLGGDYPALYPALDMFMAPFLAKMAIDIDEVLVLQQQQGQQQQGGGGGGEFVHGDDTDVFLATFVALNAFGMVVCAVLCVLASHVKLANLALFLPYPVLCGFFSSVGLSIWMSSFKVDTGITVQHFWGSEHRLFSVMKHIPSIISGIALYFLAPKSPVYLIGIIACTIVLAYSTMLLTGTSLHEAQTLGFFWEEKEVVMSPQAHHGYPMHLWSHGFFEKISLDAFMNGVPDVIAMGLIYLIRVLYKLPRKSLIVLRIACVIVCSNTHNTLRSRLKRNLANYLRNKEAAAASSDSQSSFTPVKDTKEDRQPKRKPKDVLEVLMQFANTQFVTAIFGGFAVIPSVGLSNTFVKIGSERRAPQLVACLLVLGCYLSNFRLIAFVPKCTFSSLLVMAAIDLITNWFIKSFRKTGSEWFVIPFIVLSGQMFGVLQSVALGVGISTLMFVSAFYQAGTVKFIANGLTIRSTIERHSEDNVWLDRNGDMIQTLVLQNYLFFGNATSVLKYISSMFDDIDVVDDSLLPPKPKYLVLDMSIVSGMDISAVDCFADGTSLCKTQGCKLIISGASRVVRHALIAGGVKPASHPHLSFVEDLEKALGMAEDGLLKFVGRNEERIQKNHLRGAHLRRMSQVDIGLRLALKQIDEQHNLSFANYLQGLAEYTTAMDLKAGEQLDLPRGLYFVESGLIKAEHDANSSLTRGRQRLFATPVMGRSTDSIGQLNARSATIGRGQAVLKSAPGMMSQFSHTFRLARVGPGFVIGCISECTGQEIPGTFICMTESRVHYLPFETIEELEISNPVLIMHLYKLLAFLGARRQELTIGQLSTLRSIMSSTAPSKPISRKSMALCR